MQCRRPPGSIPGLGRSSGKGIGYPLQCSWASLVAQLVKNPPAMRETWVWSLGWKIPWRRERLPTPVFWPGESHGLYRPWGHKESDTTEQLSLGVLSYFSRVQLFATPWTIAHEAPVSMGFSRQEYWSCLPFPPPGDLLDPRTELVSPASPEVEGARVNTN